MYGQVYVSAAAENIVPREGQMNCLHCVHYVCPLFLVVRGIFRRTRLPSPDSSIYRRASSCCASESPLLCGRMTSIRLCTSTNRGWSFASLQYFGKAAPYAGGPCEAGWIGVECGLAKKDGVRPPLENWSRST